MPTKRNKSENESSDDTLKAILEELKLLNRKLSSLEDKVDNIERSMDYHAEEVTKVKADVEEIKSILPDIKQSALNQQNDSLNKSVEIHGVPHHADENLCYIVCAIAKKVDQEIHPVNLDVLYRRSNKKAIVVRFVQTHVRNKFLRAVRSLSNAIQTKDIGYKTSDRIYVNELLSFATRQLFYQARKFKVRHKLAYVWTVNQKIFIRKTVDSTAVRIVHEEDLNELLSN